MRNRQKHIVYLVGVMVLGLAYEPVKAGLGGGWLFAACVLAYLIALRFVGAMLSKAKKWDA